MVLLYPNTPPSYFALTVCGAGATATVDESVVVLASMVRGRWAKAAVEVSSVRSRTAVNLIFVLPVG
jgi:hypothetical protein